MENDAHAPMARKYLKYTFHETYNEMNTVIILSFRTDRSGQTVQTQIRLLL